MKFADIVGHKDIVDSLRRSVDIGKIPHALLFAGSSGTGKFRMARAFAQYIHCKDRKNGDSCGKCPSCLQHQNHNNPDLHFVYPIIKKDGITLAKDRIEVWRDFIEKDSYMPPEGWNEYLKAGNSQPVIYVDESEEIIRIASLSAYQENFKIFIIWLPEKLRLEAANKLLKVFEEPFEDTIFIMVSNNDSRLLPTILSRTQRFFFNTLPSSLIIETLRNAGVEENIAIDAAEISGGSISKALELTFHPDEFNLFSDLFKEMMRSAYALRAKSLKLIADEIAGFGREKIIRFLSYSNRLIRENFIYNYGNPELYKMTAGEKEFSFRFSPFIHPGNVERLEAEISRAAVDIERNANSKIVLFDLMLIISRLVRTAKTEDFPTSDDN